MTVSYFWGNGVAVSVWVSVFPWGRERNATIISAEHVPCKLKISMT